MAFSSFNSLNRLIKPTGSFSSSMAQYYSSAYLAFNGSSFNPSTKTMTDQSPNERNITFSAGTMTNPTVTGNGATKSFPVIDGDRLSTCVLFAANSALANSTTFTIIFVARALGTHGNIFATEEWKFILGFFGSSSGVCYTDYIGWINPISNYYTNNFWICTLRTDTFRRNSIQTTNAGAVKFPSDALKICPQSGHGGNPFQIAEFMVFNTTLSDTTVTNIETELQSLYGISKNV
jgi:hypothetical protein